jgi:hypothetical protein
VQYRVVQRSEKRDDERVHRSRRAKAIEHVGGRTRLAGAIEVVREIHRAAGAGSLGFELFREDVGALERLTLGFRLGFGLRLGLGFRFGLALAPSVGIAATRQSHPQQYSQGNDGSHRASMDPSLCHPPRRPSTRAGLT